MRVIRPAVHTDAERIAEITVAAWHVAYEGFIPPEIRAAQTVEPALRYFEFAVQNPEKRTWVAEDDEQVVGYAHIGEARDDDVDPDSTAELWSMYVDPDRTSEGFGSQLMDTATQSMRSHNYTGGVLWVLTDNARARAFYERHGWADDHTPRTVTTESGFDLRELRYRIDLTG